MDRVKPGNIEDFKKSSEDRVSLTLIRKDFSGKMLEGVKLEKSIIAKCVFNDSKIYNSEFSECEFTKDSFAKAVIMGVDFSKCTFFSVNFSGCRMSHVKFDEECKFIDSHFDNVEMNDDVIGLSSEDQKVITETEAAFSKELADAGFNSIEDGTYELQIGQYVKCVAYLDTEMGSWRMSYFVDDECVFTSEISDKDKADFIGKVKMDLMSVRRKISNKDEFDDMDGEIAEIDEFLKN